MTVLLLGGTGHLGRACIPLAEAAGHRLRLARRPQVDLRTGAGIAEAVRGADAIVFAAGDPKRHRQVEVEGLRRLVEAALQAQIPHLIFVSIVGVDRIPIPYYRSKVAAEALLGASGLGHTILRATQFHSFIDAIFSGLARFPFILPLPRGFHVQPVATPEVAARVVQCLADGPRGLLPDYGGPQVFTLREAAEAWRRFRGVRKRIVEIPVPGAAAAALRAGANTNPAGELGRGTWAQWLAESPHERAPGA